MTRKIVFILGLMFVISNFLLVGKAESVCGGETTCLTPVEIDTFTRCAWSNGVCGVDLPYSNVPGWACSDMTVCNTNQAHICSTNDEGICASQTEATCAGVITSNTDLDCSGGSCCQFGAPTNTLVPPSNTPAPFCGDGSCNNGENCGSCSGDCGVCAGPTNTPTRTPTPTPVAVSCIDGILAGSSSSTDVQYYMTNNTTSTVTITSLTVTWPTAGGRALNTVAVYPVTTTVWSGSQATSPFTINSFIVGTDAARTLTPGQSKFIQAVFSTNTAVCQLPFSAYQISSTWTRSTGGTYAQCTSPLSADMCGTTPTPVGPTVTPTPTRTPTPTPTLGAGCWGTGGVSDLACTIGSIVPQGYADCGPTANCVGGGACSINGTGVCYKATGTASFFGCDISGGGGSCAVCEFVEQTCVGTTQCSWISPCGSTPTPTPTPTPIATPTATPIPQPNWYQAVGGDMVAMGAINANVPGTLYWCPTVADIACGVAVSATASTNIPLARIAQTPYEVATAADLQVSNFVYEAGLDKFNFNYFLERVLAASTPCTLGSTVATEANLTSGVAGCTTDGVFYWRNATGDVDFSDATLDLGTNKVVVLVDRNVTLSGNINVTNWNGSDGGMFVLIVRGNISVIPNVGSILLPLSPQLEGVYMADGVFDTGVSSTRYLRVEGAVAAHGGVTFGRAIGGLVNPGEYFLYRPDLVNKLPRPILRQNVFWSEIQ